MDSDATEHKVQIPPQIHSLPETNAVSLKLPIFWPKDPIIWFAQTEAHFNARNITAEQTKFNYLVTSLDQDTALRVKDLLLTGLTSNPYTILKTRLIEIFTLSLSDRANRLLSIKSLGGRKPSELMCDVVNLAGAHEFCFVIKQIFINAMPPEIRLHLENLDFADPHAAARTADSLWFAAQQQEHQNSAVYAISSYPKLKSDSEQHYCYYHRRFGKKATKCTQPCRYTASGNDSANRD